MNINREYSESDLYFIILVGLSGSGKSKLAKKISNDYKANIHSTKNIKQEFDEMPFEDVKFKNIKIYNTIFENIEKDLQLNKNIILDATNLTFKKRNNFLNLSKKYNCFNVCYLILEEFEQCVLNKKNEDNNVATDFIKKQLFNFQVPFYEEGFNRIIIERENCKTIRFDEFLASMKNFNNGKDCLLSRCLFLSRLISKESENINLFTSATLQDYGKINFESSKSNFFNFKNIGAYNILCNLDSDSINDLLETAFYMNYTTKDFIPNNICDFLESDKYKNLLLLEKCNLNL